MQLIQTGGSADAYYSASGVCRGTSEGFLAAACFRPTTGSESAVCGVWGTDRGWRLLCQVNAIESSVTVQLELGGITTATLFTLQNARGRLIHVAFGCIRLGGDVQTFLVVNGNVVASDLVAAAGGFLPATTPLVVGDDLQDSLIEFQGLGFSNIEQFAGDYDAVLRAASASWSAVAQTEAMYLATTYAAFGSSAATPWDVAWDSQSAVDSGPLLYSSTGRPLTSDTWKPRAGSVPLTLQASGAGRVSSLHSALWLQPAAFVLPPVVATWRESTPFIQASWRRDYGATAADGRIVSVVDGIAPGNKTIPHAQYFSYATTPERRPVDGGDSFIFVRSVQTSFNCNVPHYLQRFSGLTPFTYAFCYRALGNSQLDILWLLRGSATFLNSKNIRVDTPACRFRFANLQDGSDFANCPNQPANITYVVVVVFDGTTNFIYLGGVLQDSVVPSVKPPSIDPIDDWWGAPYLSSNGTEGNGYERLLCAGALTGPEVATLSANMAADYPP